jgi:hypothetical protein
MKRSNKANGQTMKKTLSMTMKPQFDFQPEGPDQKKPNQPVALGELIMDFK